MIKTGDVHGSFYGRCMNCDSELDIAVKGFPGTTGFSQFKEVMDMTDEEAQAHNDDILRNAEVLTITCNCDDCTDIDEETLSELKSWNKALVITGR